MLKNTQGLVLRNIKYGETSLISTIYTRDFGMQAYIVRGARSNKKTGIKANYFQIGQFLDLTVYHKPDKNIQYLKEVKLNAEQAIQSQNIIRQSVVQFCCELILRCIQEEETNAQLYTFLYSFFQDVKQLNSYKLSLAPITFIVQFASKIGFEIHNNYTAELQFFDALNGNFCQEISLNQYIANLPASQLIANCLSNKEHINSTNKTREEALHALILFLRLQIEQMGEIKSVAILHQILHST